MVRLEGEKNVNISDMHYEFIEDHTHPMISADADGVTDKIKVVQWNSSAPLRY